MKNLFIVAFLLITATGFSQEKKEMSHRDKMEKKSPEERNEMKLKKMTADLNLDVKQQKQMADFMAERSAKKAKQREENRAAHKEQIDKDREVMNAKMKGILSPEQFKKWEASKEKHHERRAHHKGHLDGHKEGHPKEEIKK
jgi:protein CpxP